MLDTPPPASDYLQTFLHPPLPSDDKYSRGVVSLVTGSLDYPGAALLGVGAAIATGVGMVRYVGQDPVSQLVVATHPEAVIGPGPSDALVVGSGFPAVTEEWCRARLEGFDDSPIPAVVDAGAMVHRQLFPGPVILTPHPRELARLAEHFGAPAGRELEQAAWLAETLAATVVVKKHRTVVVSPDGSTLVLDEAPTWLATAGTGDVLAGIMGAVCAMAQAAAPTATLSHDQCRDIASVACWIHSQACRLASTTEAGEWGRPVSASRLITSLPDAVAGALLPPPAS